MLSRSTSRIYLPFLVAALLAVGLAACGGSGGGGTNTSALKEAEEHGEEKKAEEEKESRLETEIQELKLERQQEKKKALRRQRQRARARKHQSNGSSGETQPAPSPETAPAPESDIKSCGGSLTATLDTTCEFAQNVEYEYYEYIGSGSGYVEAFSPELNQYFSMFCTGSPHECSGAIDAKVYFP